MHIISTFVFPQSGPHPDIVFFQETHSIQKYVKQWKCNFKCKQMFFSHTSVDTGGLLIAVKPYVVFEPKHVIRSKSYLIVHCVIDGETYTLVNVHNTNFGRAAHDRRLIDWFTCLWNDVQKFPTHRILIGGDFNCHLDSKLDSLDRRPLSLYWLNNDFSGFCRF